MSDSDGDSRVQSICLLVLTILAIGVALAYLRPVLVPFVLALFCGLVLTPVVNLLVRKWSVPHPVAVILTLVLVLILFVFISAIVTTSLSGLAENAGSYAERLEQLLDQISEALPLEKLGFEREPRLSSLFDSPAGSVRELLLQTTNSLMNIFSQGVLVFIFVLFILFGAKTGEEPVGGVWGKVEFRVKRYIITKVLASAVTGTLVSVILSILGVDFAMAFGFLAFVLNFVPSIGSVISTVLPIPVVLLAPEFSMTTLILAVALPGLVQFLIGNVIEPKVMGDSLDLHPVVILLALIFWGMMWGTVGMLLATPITAVLKIVFERIAVTAPIASVMAGDLDFLKQD